MAKSKIQVSESTVKPLHFIDIYVPVLGDEPPSVLVDHHEKYLHILIAVEGRPMYKVIGEPTFRQYFDEIMFGEYAFWDFWDLCDKEEK